MARFLTLQAKRGEKKKKKRRKKVQKLNHFVEGLRLHQATQKNCIDLGLRFPHTFNSAT